MGWLTIEICRKCGKEFNYMYPNQPVDTENIICSVCTKALADEHEKHHFIQLEEMDLLSRVRRIERVLYRAVNF